MRTSLRTAGIAVAALLALPLAAQAALAGGASPAAGRAVLAGSSPGWATAAAAVGDAPAGAAVDLFVYLPLRHAAAAQAALAAVSDPRSPAYRHYLTPAQFRAAYAPTDADAAAVTGWLTSSGFQVVADTANHHAIEVTGTVAQAQAAFGVRMRSYRVDGAVRTGIDRDASVPAALAGSVLGVGGLSDWPMAAATTQKAPAGVRVGKPCSAFYGQLPATGFPTAYGDTQPYAVCGYTPQQMQGAYGMSDLIAAGHDGHGVTVGIIDAYLSPTLRGDLRTYSAAHGLPAVTDANVRIIRPARPYDVVDTGNQGQPCQSPGIWAGEQTLDVEAVHAMAPGAGILYVGASGCDERYLDQAMNTIVDGGLAQIISNSYGDIAPYEPETSVQSVEQTLVQAGLEGIGTYFASGDAADWKATTHRAEVIYPGSSPNTTAVGGTSIGIGSAQEYLFETGWMTGRSVLSPDGTAWTPPPPGAYFGGAGGGTSRRFAEPGYQKGAVPAALATRFRPDKPARVVPDVAAEADPNTGFLVGETQTFPDGVYYDEYRLGGTSLATPLFAGMMAVADEYAGYAHGFANPALYAVAGTAALHDVVPPAHPYAEVRVNYVNSVDPSAGLAYSVRTLGAPLTSLSTAPGYDTLTGIGTPNGVAFVRGLAGR